jgi:prophage DNA circulation protein
MDAFDQLLHASFDFIEFPVRKVTVKGGIREHDHEYPKVPGAAAEKLGRKLYTISMSVPFHNNLRPPWDESLWPGALSDLRNRFEEEITSDLLIPTIGTIKAFCTNWTQVMDARVRSGEDAELEFKEDQSNLFLLDGIINIKATSLAPHGQALTLAADAAGLADVFAELEAQIDGVTALIGTAELYSAAGQAKVLGLINTFERLDATVGALNDPANAPLLEVYLEAWASAQALQQDLLRQQRPLVLYEVPALMAISDVSRAIYGDTSKAADILGLNPIEDAFAIKRGTQLRVYAPAA